MSWARSSWRDASTCRSSLSLRTRGDVTSLPALSSILIAILSYVNHFLFLLKGSFSQLIQSWQMLRWVSLASGPVEKIWLIYCSFGDGGTITQRRSQSRLALMRKPRTDNKQNYKMQITDSDLSQLVTKAGLWFLLLFLCLSLCSAGKVNLVGATAEKAVFSSM